MSDQFRHLSEDLGLVFTELKRRAQVNVELADRVREALSGPEKDHVVSATYRDDTLVILVDSAAWCPHIRYAQQPLLQRLRAIGETRFTKMKVRVGRKADSG